MDALMRNGQSNETDMKGGIVAGAMKEERKYESSVSNTSKAPVSFHSDQ